MYEPSLNRFGSNGNFFVIFFSLEFFCRAFFAKNMGHPISVFPQKNVHIFHMMWFYFIKNPFCYFSIKFKEFYKPNNLRERT